MGWRVLDSVLYLLCSVAPSGGLGAAAGGERAAGVGLDLLVRKLHGDWMLASVMLLRTRLRDADTVPVVEVGVSGPVFIWLLI